MKASGTSIPARYPPIGVWPAQMRADMAAAYLDHRDTAELATAIARGDAPPPSCLRGAGRSREPVWAKAILDRFVAPLLANDQNDDRSKENLRALV
jgi:hypothetical protein